MKQESGAILDSYVELGWLKRNALSKKTQAGWGCNRVHIRACNECARACAHFHVRRRSCQRRAATLRLGTRTWSSLPRSRRSRQTPSRDQLASVAPSLPQLPDTGDLFGRDRLCDMCSFCSDCSFPDTCVCPMCRTCLVRDRRARAKEHRPDAVRRRNARNAAGSPYVILQWGAAWLALRRGAINRCIHAR